MSPLHHILRRAQRRALAHQALHRVGLGLSAGVAAAIVLLLFDRFTSIEVPQIGYWLLPACGVIGSVIYAFASMPDRFALAVQLDRALRLKDRIGTATMLVHYRASPSTDPEFAELVDRDAQRLAESLDVRKATPIHPTRVWAAIVPLAALFGAGYLWLPHVDLFARAARTQVTLEKQQIVQTEAQQVAATISNTVADLPRDESLDEAARSDLEALDRLAQQLNEQSVPPEELAKTRDESAARLNELADRLAQQSQREMAAAEEIARRFEGMDKTGAPKPPMSAQEFNESLTRGDFGEAARQLQELLDNQSLPELERNEAADHLRELASHIERDLAQNTPEQVQQMREQLEQALRDQGIDEQTIQDMMESPPPPSQVEEELKQQNVDEDVARELARDIDEQHQQRETEEQAQRDAQQVQDALQKAAEQLEQPPQQRPQQQQQQQDKQSPERPEGTKPDSSTPDSAKQDQPSERTDQPQSDQSKPRDQAQTSQQRQQQQQQQQQSKPDESKPGEPQSQQHREQKPTGSEQQTGEQREQKPTQSEQQTGEQREQQSAQSQEPKSGEQREQSTPQSQRDQSARQDSTQLQKPDPLAPGSAERQSERQAQPDGTQPQPQPSPATSRDPSAQPKQSDQAREGESQPPSTPAEALRRLAERGGKAEDRQQASERMKQAARELAQRMTPEERERWAQQWRRQQGESDQQQQPFGAGSPENVDGQPSNANAPPKQPTPPPFQTDELDLRGKETADQIIAQWLNEDVSGAESPQRTQTAPAAVRQAREVAERAVNEAAVQKRYHRAIQRYFGRLNETASKAASEPAPAKPE